MILQDTYRLSNGVAVPKIGLGTWMIPDGEVGEVVRQALGVGYRHIDTAQDYGNERGVGEGVRASGVRREDVFVTSKLVAECKRYDEAVARIEGSLKALDLDYIDLMLIHCPQPWALFRNGEHYFEGNLEAWRALEAAHTAGKLRAIGVSNFEPVDVENLLTHGSVAPMVNQVRAFIGETPTAELDHARAHDMLAQAYSPIGHGDLLKRADLGEMAAGYGVGIAQLSIRYCLQLGLSPLPKTRSLERLRQNADVDFEISDADMRTLLAL